MSQVIEASNGSKINIIATVKAAMVNKLKLPEDFMQQVMHLCVSPQGVCR